MIPLVLPLTALAFLAVYIQKGLIIVGFALAALISLAVLWRERQFPDWRRLIDSPSTKAILAVLVLWLVSGLFGVDPMTSLRKWAEYLGLVILGFALYGAMRERADWGGLISVVFWGALMFSAWAVIDMAYLLPRVTLFLWGPWQNATSYSTVLSLLFPFVLWHASQSRKAVYWLVPFAMTAAIFACGGRSGWLAYSVVALCALAILPWTLWLQRVAAFLTSVSGAALGVMIYSLNVGALKFEERVAGSVEHGLGTGRIDIWRASWDKFLENPLLGVGPRNFRALDFSPIQLTSTSHPHNVPLELLVETGILGFGAALCAVGVLLAEYIRKFRARSAMAACAFAALAGYATASMTLTSIFHAWWFVAGMTLFIWMKLALDDIRT